MPPSKRLWNLQILEEQVLVKEVVDIVHEVQHDVSGGTFREEARLWFKNEPSMAKYAISGEQECRAFAAVQAAPELGETGDVVVGEKRYDLVVGHRGSQMHQFLGMKLCGNGQVAEQMKFAKGKVIVDGMRGFFQRHQEVGGHVGDRRCSFLL